MNLNELGIATSSTREIFGSRVQYACSQDEQQLDAFLAHMPPGVQILIPEPGGAECWLEARRDGRGYHIKRGCHGAHGTWRSATFEEVRSWLRPGLEVPE